MPSNHSFPQNENDLKTQLAELLQELLGSQARLTGLSVSKRLDDYRVALVELESPHRSLVIKLAGPDAPLASPFERTASLLKLIKQRTRVPVAEVVAADASYQRWPWRYLVMARRPGLQWVQAREQMDAAGRDLCYAQLGEAVAELHAIQFAGYGELPPSLNLPANRDFAAAWEARAPQPLSRTSACGPLSWPPSSRAGICSWI